MNPDKQKSLDAMRTYARDVAREKGEPVEAVETKTDPKVPEPKKSEPKKVPKIIARPPKRDKKKEKSEVKADKKPEKTPKQIPPFHELQRAVKTNIKAEEKSAKKEDQKPSGINPTKPVGGGTVITDTKKSGPSFFGELQKSLSDWVSSLKKTLKPKKKNAYAVTRTERRRGVVQKATSKTGTIFTADSETLREQIKARQRAEKHEHDDLNWSPFTEPGYPLLEGDEATSADPRVTKLVVEPKTHTVPKPVIKSTEKIPELQEPEETDELFGVPVEEPSDEPTESPPVSKETAEESTEPDTESTEEAEPGQKTEEEAEEDETWHLEDVSLRDTNTLAMLLVGLVLGVGLLGFVLFAIFDVDEGQNEISITKEPEVALFSNTPLKSIVLPEQTFNDLIGAINTAVITEGPETTKEFKFVNSAGKNVPIETLVALLRTGKTDEFADVVKNVRFIHTADNERALLITAVDGESVLGGMLNWEDSLLSDLGAVLDIRDVPPSAGSFVDGQLGDLNLRSLVFDGESLLVYAVFDGATVIIATDSSVLEMYQQN